MSHVRTPLYPVLLLPLQSVLRLLSLIGLHEPLRGLQGILLRGQLERDGRLFALRLDEHALLVLPGHAGDDGKVELRQPEAERAALLGDVADAGGAGAGAQQRNGDEELATLGAVKTFTSLDAANRFLRQAGRQDLRICGLNAFEPQQGSLVLPRLEWRRCGGRAVLRLVLHSDISLREDAATARAFLASLTTTQATPGAIPPLLSERHSSDYPQWQAMIARATKAISAGEMDKVVLARATDLQFAGRREHHGG